MWSCVSFFFFQAEDGIRDYKVTGVQTCALPISCAWALRSTSLRPWWERRSSMTCSTGGGGWNGSASRGGYVGDPRQNVHRFHGGAGVLPFIFGRACPRRPDRAGSDLAGGGETWGPACQ